MCKRQLRRRQPQLVVSASAQCVLHSAAEARLAAYLIALEQRGRLPHESATLLFICARVRGIARVVRLAPALGVSAGQLALRYAVAVGTTAIAVRWQLSWPGRRRMTHAGLRFSACILRCRPPPPSPLFVLAAGAQCGSHGGKEFSQKVKTHTGERVLWGVCCLFSPKVKNTASIGLGRRWVCLFSQKVKTR